MKQIKYLFQSIGIIFLFLTFKILGLKNSKSLSVFIFKNIGPLFRSKNISSGNISIAFPELNETQKKEMITNMWINYGKIFAEYMFIKDFRYSDKLIKNIIVENQKGLENIKLQNKPVIFISGHFNNFELMAMQLEKAGIDLTAIYRPLNNKYLNNNMEFIRKNFICKKQIKKGRSGSRELIKNFKNGSSIALMIDQRVREGISVPFFNKFASTTTIPAQLVKKYNCEIVPIYIERIDKIFFKMHVSKPINFQKDNNISNITLKLNQILEKMILKNVDQWIWTHNRWKK